MTKTTELDILAEARRLRSEHGENPEYDRALVELCMQMVPLSRNACARKLGILDRAELEDFVQAFGFGTLTEQGFELARELFCVGDDYATIAHECVYRGYTASTPERV